MNSTSPTTHEPGDQDASRRGGRRHRLLGPVRDIRRADRVGAAVGLDGPGTWVDDDARRNAVSLSLQLLPFAGIAFLWFIGVLRDRIGAGEDRFFATVFLGSGLLFVAMFFVSGAMAGGLISTAADASAGRSRQRVAVRSSQRGQPGRLSTGCGWRPCSPSRRPRWPRDCRLVPRWLAVLGYATAAVLLLGVGLVPWLELVFPGWVFALSVHILIVTFVAADAPSVLVTEQPMT